MSLQSVEVIVKGTEYRLETEAVAQSCGLVWSEISAWLFSAVTWAVFMKVFEILLKCTRYCTVCMTKQGTFHDALYSQFFCYFSKGWLPPTHEKPLFLSAGQAKYYMRGFVLFSSFRNLMTTFIAHLVNPLLKSFNS